MGLGGDETARHEPEEARRELAAILASTSFRGSKRCQDFLGHVVARALEGDVESLKERALAVEIYGRKANADLGEDSIVRVGAREVRKRLTQYYMSEGAHDALRIDLPSGSYVPVFRRAEKERERVEGPETARSARFSASGRRRLWFALAVAALAASAPILAWRASHPAASLFETFWQPAFAQPTPVLLVLAHPIVYHPSSRAARMDVERNGPPAIPVQRPIDLPPDELNGADYVPVLDQYVGFGDAVAASRLSGLFAPRGRPVRVRMASKVNFADMRDSASVLIGAFTNRWTMELSQDLRYRFAFAGQKPCILDSGSGKEYALTGKSDDGRSTEDYLIICRLLRARTGGFVLIGAGLTQYGTEEAGRILAEPNALVPLLRMLPPAWRSQNLELVLHSQVVGDTLASPELVAAHTW
jgi:hypothetical protein